MGAAGAQAPSQEGTQNTQAVPGTRVGGGAAGVAPEGNIYVTSGSWDKSVKLWSIAPKKLKDVKSFEDKHDKPINALSFSADGKRMASGRHREG